MSNVIKATTINPIRTALMPVSQLIAWYWVIKNQNDIIGLYLHVMLISIFYCLWALYSTIIEKQFDLGLYSMGICALVCYYHYYYKITNSSYNIILYSVGFVLFNYLLPSYMILIAWDAKKLAKIAKNDITPTGITWAYVTKVYFISNIILWSYIFYRFYKLTSTSRYSMIADQSVLTNEVKHQK